MSGLAISVQDELANAEWTMKSSPLYQDTFALCGVLLEAMETRKDFRELNSRLCRGALRLLDFVVLAVAGFDRHDRLLDADEELRTFRVHLSLALELGLLDEEAFLAYIEQADRIGRQIGGWLRKLEQLS